MRGRAKDARSQPADDTIAAVDGRRTTDAEGYVEEIPYTYGYHPELDPLRMQAVLRRAGLHPPAVRTACELGYGQGVSLAIHAVAGQAQWYGTDLHPMHARGVGALTAGTGARLDASDQPFAAYCAREDLPSFDFVGAYGVWSWVSAANRRRLVDFVARRLRPGGVLFLSYNALPGWTPMLPLREVMVAHVAALPVTLPLEQRIDAALRHLRMRLLHDGPFAEANPQASAELRAIVGKGAAYLAHEFFNRDWAPMDPAEVAQLLGAAGLRFAAHADGGEPARSARFRREYWLKEATGRPAETHAAAAAGRAAGCQVLNERLLALATRAPGVAWLASPVTGGGVEVGHATMLLLEAWQRGLHDPAALAVDVEATLARLGQRLVQAGEVITERSRTLAMLETAARVLPQETLPRLQALEAL